MNRTDLTSIFFSVFVFLLAYFAPVCSAANSPYSFTVEWASLAAQAQAELDLPFTIRRPLPTAVIWLHAQNNYHAYSYQSGAGAYSTTISLHSEASLHGQIRYPQGKVRPDFFDPAKNSEIYEGNTPIFLLFADAPTESISAQISLLACSSTNCVPIRETITLAPPSDLPDAANAAWLTALYDAQPYEFMAAKPVLPPVPWQAQLDLPPTAVFSQPAEDDAAIDAPDIREWDFDPRPYQAALEVRGLGKAFFFGLVAGLLLNIMPCVLPVLTLKISSLLIGVGEPVERRRKFREHNLLFGAGILTWFAVLALLFGLAGLAWGQIFQSRAVVFGMTLIIFALGLTMFDVFHLPALDFRVGKTSNPKLQAYTTGLLATLLATPCSGPLLGGVLGWSLLQSLPVLLAVFLATGLGMALPYLLLALRPGLANHLPKPGAWMLALERILGFFLMGTVLYLLSILPEAMLIRSLAALLITALCAWVWGQWGSLRGAGLSRVVIGLGAFLTIGLSAAWAFGEREAAVRWEPFVAEDFAVSLGSRPLLLEFTADWCPSCKVLERVTLTDSNLAPLVAEYGLRLIRVDMTKSDAHTTTLLRALNSASIPLLAVFPPGPEAQPVILRDLYTAEQLRGLVRQALGGR